MHSIDYIRCLMHSIEPYWYLMHSIEPYWFPWCTALSHTDAWCISMNHGCTASSHGAQYWAIMIHDANHWGKLSHNNNNYWCIQNWAIWLLMVMQRYWAMIHSIEPWWCLIEPALSALLSQHWAINWCLSHSSIELFWCLMLCCIVQSSLHLNWAVIMQACSQGGFVGFGRAPLSDSEK